MKNLAIRSIAKIVLAIVLCMMLSMVVSNFAPHISNDMAIGQLENDDMSWTAFQTWNNALAAVGWVQAGICLACAGSVSVSVIKYIKNRKENTNEVY